MDLTPLFQQQPAPDIPWGVLLGPWGLTAFLLLVVVYGGVKRLWVFGWQYAESERRADEWKHLALRGTNAAESSTNVAEQMLGHKLEELQRLIDEMRGKVEGGDL